jgi:hypothetical protein
LSLKSLYLPALVRSINPEGFCGSSLSAITIDPANEHFSVFDSFLLNFSGPSLIRYFGSAEIVFVNSTVSIISPFAFYPYPRSHEGPLLRMVELFCSPKTADVSGSFLKSIFVPGTVTILGQSCFDSCWSLSDVRFESDSQLSTIDNRAFHGCSSLQTITVHGIADELEAGGH